MLLQDRGDVLTLEADARLLERSPVGENDRPAVEAHEREHVLEPDAGDILRSVDDPFEHRLQLAGVAAPRQRRDERQRRSRQHLRRHAQICADFADEIVGERRDVLAPAPQRRHVDADHREALEQLVADPSVLQRGVEL